VKTFSLAKTLVKFEDFHKRGEKALHRAYLDDFTFISVSSPNTGSLSLIHRFSNLMKHQNHLESLEEYRWLELTL
jgi:hypothetical protein